MRWLWAQWFEKKWWLHYLKSRPKTEYLDWKQQYWSKFKVQLDLYIRSGSKVLDAGCGPAGIFICLNDCTVTASDPLLDFYEYEISHFSAKDYPNVEFHTQPIESIPWENEFDFVFCLNVINHVKDFDQAFSRLAAAAKPNHSAIISIDCHNFNMAKWLFRALPFDILHPHQFGLREYLSKFESAGLSIEKKVLIKTGFFFNYYAVCCTKN